MKRRVASIVLAVLLGMGSLGVFPAVGSAESESAAATKYANCTALHRHFYRYGVARSAAAARRQVASGHYKPRVSRRVYRANSTLDADKDGTACEVTR
jgi:Excalibur calcium-binding domain